MKCASRCLLLSALGLLLATAPLGCSDDSGAGRPPGDPCVGNTDCADSLCHEGSCAAAVPDRKDEGQACEGDYECWSYRCTSGTCGVGNLAGGGVCFDGRQCLSLQCLGGTCGKDVPTTDAYVPDRPDKDDAAPPDGPMPDGPTPDGPTPDAPTPDLPAPDGGCGSDPDCDDKNDCTDDKCNQTTKQCENTPIPNIGCDDGNACTHTDTCDATGTCKGTDYSATCQATLCEDAVCDGQGGCTKNIKAGTCKIGTTTPICALAGNKKPNTGGCEACDPAQSPTAWSFVDGKGCLKTLVKATGNSYNDGPLGSGVFAQPLSMTLDDVGKKLYILDTSATWQGKVRRFDLVTGDLQTIVGPKGQTPPTSGAVNGKGVDATFKGPTSIAFDAKNKRLYVADRGNCLLRMIDLNQAETSPGFVTTAAGQVGPCGTVDGPVATATLHPTAVAVDSTGKVLIGSQQQRLRRYDPALKDVSTLYTGMPGWLIAMIDDNTVFTPRSGYYNLWTIDLGLSSMIHFAGLDVVGGCVDGAAKTLAEFKAVNGVSVLGSGATARVFVGDDHTLREISSGQVKTLVGLCGQKGTADGAATARLNGITSTAVTSGKVVYLIDTLGLRRYTLP